MVSDRARTAGFMAVRMAYRYPWRTGGLAAASATVGAGLEVTSADPTLVLVPGGLAVTAGCLGWWWLRRAGRQHARRRFPAAGVTAGVASTALGIAVHAGQVTDPGVVLAPGGTLVVAGCTGWWWLRHVGRPHSVRAAIGRRAELDQRSGGVASWLDIAEVAGVSALRRRAGVLRPVTVAGLSRWQRRHLDPSQLGVEVARLGWGLPGQRVWSSIEDATLRIAPPRAGKTISLACHAWDAPGALITTSTRLDLAEMVHAARAARGAVYFFNPLGLGGIPTTLKWRVLGGCEDFQVAQRRAADLMPVSAVAEVERWDAEGRRVLAILLHAAAVSGQGMRAVVRWNGDPGERTRTEVETALLAGGPGGRDRVDAMRQHWGINERTRTSVTATISAPLAWVRDERVRPLADFPADEVDQVDLAQVILRGQTLHLLGHETNTGVSPLIAALVAQIAETILTLAEQRPGGRLDPPVTMVLDEIALVCPIPLDRWSAHMGGKGGTIHAAVQSLAQLRQAWGPDGAGAILGNIGSLIVFGGSVSPDDLRDLSQLTGEHRMRVVGVDHDGVDQARDGELRGEYRWVSVLSPSQIRALDPMQVLVLQRGLHTLVGWTPKIIDRRGWVKTNLRPVDPLEAEITTSTGRRDDASMRALAGLRALTRLWARLTRRPVTVTIPADPVGPAAAGEPVPGGGWVPDVDQTPSVRLHVVNAPSPDVAAPSDADQDSMLDEPSDGREVDGERSTGPREALDRWTRPAAHRPRPRPRPTDRDGADRDGVDRNGVDRDGQASGEVDGGSGRGA